MAVEIARGLASISQWAENLEQLVMPRRYLGHREKVLVTLHLFLAASAETRFQI